MKIVKCCACGKEVPMNKACKVANSSRLEFVCKKHVKGLGKK